MPAQPRGRGAQVARQWQLISLLDARRGGASARDLADALGAQVRTVYRDLEQLQAAGVPLEVEKDGPNARWRFTAGYRQRLAAPLSLLEVCALAAVRGALAPLAGTVVGDAAQQALAKIRAGIPDAVLARLEQGGVLDVVAPEGALADRGTLVRALVEAIEAHRTVEVRYRSRARGRETARRIDPYRLFVQGGVLYLAGRCHERDATRTFRVDRFRLAVATERRFEPPAFDLEAYLGDSFAVTRGPPVHLRVRLSRDAAELVRTRPVHRTQRLADDGDGAILELEAALGPELRGWVLSLGADAEVLEPEDLRRAVAAAHEHAAARYRTEGSRRLPADRAAARATTEPPSGPGANLELPLRR